MKFYVAGSDQCLSQSKHYLHIEDAHSPNVQYNLVGCIFSLIYKPFIERESAGASCIATRKLENQPAGAMETQTIRDLSIEFAELVPADRFTAAEIKSYLLGLKDEPDVAVQRAAEWVKDKLGVSSCSSTS